MVRPAKGREEEPFPHRVIDRRIGPAPEPPIGVAVAFEKFEGDRAYYRDPLGERTDVGPPAQFDEATRLWSIPAAVFDREISA